eukprot:SAG11_NODE_635_length_8040_cov_3.233472_7_plen_109_part_00
MYLRTKLILGSAAPSLAGLDLSEFVSIDGDDMRSQHSGWRAHIESNRAVGYRGAADMAKSTTGVWQLRDRLKIEAVCATGETFRSQVDAPWHSKSSPHRLCPASAWCA